MHRSALVRGVLRHVGERVLAGILERRHRTMDARLDLIHFRTALGWVARLASRDCSIQLKNSKTHGFLALPNPFPFPSPFPFDPFATPFTFASHIPSPSRSAAPWFCERSAAGGVGSAVFATCANRL